LPATRHEIEGSELLDRMRLVAEAFRPAAPIDRRNLFSGRTRQIGELFAVVAQPGQHAVVYGERGVGKTSLATVAADTLRSTNVLTTRATCDTSDDFSSVWRKGLDEIVLRTATPAVGFAPSTREAVESAAGLLKSPDVRPHDVRKALGAVGQQREIVVFVDEFDRLQDPAARTLFADTIKMLSDQLVRATVVLVGVADDVNELIREHGSVERALVQVHMPRMSRAELTEIVTKGMATAQMTIGKTAADRVALLSQGLPHYTHLLSQLAAQAALDANRTDVTVRDVEFAIERAIEKAQHTIMDAYARATETTRRSLLPRVARRMRARRLRRVRLLRDRRRPAAAEQDPRQAVRDAGIRGAPRGALESLTRAGAAEARRAAALPLPLREPAAPALRRHARAVGRGRPPARPALGRLGVAARGLRPRLGALVLELELRLLGLVARARARDLVVVVAHRHLLGGGEFAETGRR
jgi:Cdc6-like AAA superfamily ATPase